MTIDWVTVIAQLANFLLLVWLLRRFLYRPILDGIDAREAEIARRMHEADIARTRALEAETQYQQQYDTLQEQQEASVALALQEVQREREQLLAETRNQLEQEQINWHHHLEHEREEFIHRLHEAGSQTLFDLVGKVLGDLADEPLEAAIARQLGRQLKPMATELTGAVGHARQAIVTSRGPLQPDIRQRVQTDLKQWLPEVEVQFKQDGEQSPGLGIQIGGVQLTWTIDSYLDELDRLMAQRHAAGLHHDLAGHAS